MPWYQSELTAIVALFIFPPAGVALTWLYQRWNTAVKAGASVASLTSSLVLLVALTGSRNPAPATHQAAVAPSVVAQAAPSAPPAAALPPEADISPQNAIPNALGRLRDAIGRLGGNQPSPSPAAAVSSPPARPASPSSIPAPSAAPASSPPA